MYSCTLHLIISLELADGTIVAERENPAVPHAVLSDIWAWRKDGISMKDAVDRLRPRTVPPGYAFNNWRPG